MLRLWIRFVNWTLRGTDYECLNVDEEAELINGLADAEELLRRIVHGDRQVTRDTGQVMVVPTGWTERRH